MMEVCIIMTWLCRCCGVLNFVWQRVHLLRLLLGFVSDGFRSGKSCDKMEG